MPTDSGPGEIELSDGPPVKKRIEAIDALRGLVMVLMALDHSRDYFGDVRIRPEDIESTTTALFFTRWVTHFCAPTFLFLSGVSAFFYGRKVGKTADLSGYLVKRGLWLLFLEFTVIRLGMLFSLTMGPWMFLVIAAIGCSMVTLGMLVWLPHRAILAIGVAILFGHNFLDGITADPLQDFASLWTLTMRPGFIANANLAVGYPFVPWLGLMLLGFGLAPLFDASNRRRAKQAFQLGVLMFAAFLIIRAGNFFGDSQAWSIQPVSADEESSPTNIMKSMFSFLSTSKYPPSLLYSLMTLGPALMVFALFDRWGHKHIVIRFLRVYGSVPLFFYIAHFYLLNLAACGIYWIRKGVPISPMRIDAWAEADIPPEYGFNDPGWLWQVYLGWILILAILFPLCLHWGRWKKTTRSWITSYL